MQSVCKQVQSPLDWPGAMPAPPGEHVGRGNVAGAMLILQDEHVGRDTVRRQLASVVAPLQPPHACLEAQALHPLCGEFGGCRYGRTVGSQSIIANPRLKPWATRHNCATPARLRGAHARGDSPRSRRRNRRGRWSTCGTCRETHRRQRSAGCSRWADRRRRRREPS